MELETFDPVELKTYIALGAVEVDESVAHLVDGEMKDRVQMLKVLSLACTFIPEAGKALQELIGSLAHLAEVPAKILEHRLPQVREAVRNGGVVNAAAHKEHNAIAKGLDPLLEAANDNEGLSIAA
ncbi:hypothetical protein IPG41_02635 [Candidatus Peregrinibacteria bacterium]|nr:MAG: hypothetical protein IPG41_02635 [Candidatus Peregrinibacteria bacterium]